MAKKKTEERSKNIGRIFRKYNIVEYKSPTDYLGIDDFYKVYGYACFYKADTGQENEIPVEELDNHFLRINRISAKNAVSSGKRAGLHNREPGRRHLLCNRRQNTYPGNCNLTIEPKEKFVALQLD